MRDSEPAGEKGRIAGKMETGEAEAVVEVEEGLGKEKGAVGGGRKLFTPNRCILTICFRLFLRPFN